MDYKLSLTQIAGTPLPALRWCLDEPAHETVKNDRDLSDPGIFLLGWVLFDDPECYLTHQIYLKQGSEPEYSRLDINRLRPDVVQNYGLAQAHLSCGFNGFIELKHDAFEIGLKDASGQYHPWYEGRVLSPLRILEGKQGWLFLDNDTNDSVAQHTGELLLNSEEVSKWCSYAAGLADLATLTEARHALLIAPAKEAVYQDMHPLPRAAETISEQVLTAIGDICKVVDPQSLLNAGREDRATFRQKDSHWTHYGAMLAAKALATALGAPRKRVDQLFESDKYNSRSLGGDLGNKCFPPQRAKEWLQVTARYRNYLIYDNELDNFGRVIMTYNEQSLSRKKLLLFGSSSSYTMLNFLCRLFRQVIFVHSAGNLDSEWIKKLKPDYLVAQTNARFMVKSPVCDYSIRDQQATKLRQHSDNQTRYDALEAQLSSSPRSMRKAYAWAQQELLAAIEIAANAPGR